MLDTAVFDELAYLDANPDVRAAVDAGAMSSGQAHYLEHGRSERRPLITRSFWLRRGLALEQMTGLEIGALCRPSITRAEGNILYVDYATRDQLAEKYVDDANVIVDELVDVDVQWSSGSLREVLGPDRTIDYVVGSHVVEHVPDPIGWLAALRETLAADGRIRLVVPDKRFTFDRLRAETTLADVLDAAINKPSAPTTRQILDYLIKGSTVDAGAAWRGELIDDALVPIHPTTYALETARAVASSGDYFDAHCWVFTPTSFAQLMGEVAQLGLLGFRCSELFTTTRNSLEFFVELVRSDDQDAIIRSWENQAAALPLT